MRTISQVTALFSFCGKLKIVVISSGDLRGLRRHGYHATATLGFPGRNRVLTKNVSNVRLICATRSPGGLFSTSKPRIWFYIVNRRDVFSADITMSIFIGLCAYSREIYFYIPNCWQWNTIWRRMFCKCLSFWCAWFAIADLTTELLCEGIRWSVGNILLWPFARKTPVLLYFLLFEKQKASPGGNWRLAWACEIGIQKTQTPVREYR